MERNPHQHKQNVRLVTREDVLSFQSQRDLNNDGVIAGNEQNSTSGNLAPTANLANEWQLEDYQTLDDVDSFYSDFDTERRDSRRKKIGAVLAGVALAAATIGSAVAVNRLTTPPDYRASDKTHTLAQGETWWDTYQDIADDYNASHGGLFDKSIDARDVGHAMDKINEPIDRDGDGSVDTPQPGDTKILPEFDD